LKEVSLDSFIDFWMRDKGYEAIGTVTGRVEALGNIKKLFLKGILGSYDGTIKDLEYDSMFLNLQGYYPNLKISESTIAKSNGMIFSVDGDVNIKDREEFKKQVKELKLAPVVKGSDSEIEWTIKKLQHDESGSTELKYLLRKSHGPSIFEEVEEDMFGIERKMEF